MNGCDGPSSVWLNGVLDTTPSLKCSWQWCWCALLVWTLNVEYIYVSNEQSLNDSERFHYSSKEYSNGQNNLTRCMSQLSHKHSTCNTPVRIFRFTRRRSLSLLPLPLLISGKLSAKKHTERPWLNSKTLWKLLRWLWSICAEQTCNMQCYL